MKKIEYKKGDIIGNLTFLEEVEAQIFKSRNMRKALFKCGCGKTFTTLISSAKSGNTISWGCYGVVSRKERFTKHGKRGHELYSVWCSIKTRCYNKNRSDYKYYGGRGITLSDEFKNSFMTWFEYVTSLKNYDKRNESNLTIDRIDNDKGYQRGNLKWSTKKEQALNQRRGLKN